MPFRGVVLILISAVVIGVGYHKQIYNYIKNLFKKDED